MVFLFRCWQFWSILLYKTKRQYLLTCKVSRYCLLALHGRIGLQILGCMLHCGDSWWCAGWYVRYLWGPSGDAANGTRVDEKRWDKFRLLVGSSGASEWQGSHGHWKSCKTMENEKIKSRPGKVMENVNLTKVMKFWIFINVYHISFEKNVLITYTFKTQWHWHSIYSCKIFYMQKGVK